MTFLHPLLLSGLLLLSIPVLIHFFLKQKPKRLLFPAFRFLVEKHRTNQRQMRLRHLLLLLLRMCLIAALCLALAGPKLFSERLHIAADQPVHALLLFDTSPSMDYTVAGKTRLDEARKHALELLDELPDGSRVAVLDSGEVGGEWNPTLALARDRLVNLKSRYGNAPVSRQLAQAYRLLQNLDEESAEQGQPLPRFLYIFSDRARNCWDAAAAHNLKQPQDVHTVFIDVGVDKAADLALIEVKAKPTTVSPGNRVTIQATVRATGMDCDSEIVLRIDGETPGESRVVQMSAGQSQVIEWERATQVKPGSDDSRRGLGPGLHQIEVRFKNGDALLFNNAAFCTFRVREGRKVLMLTDHAEAAADFWARALSQQLFHCDIQAPQYLDQLGWNELARYQAICLFNVAHPSHELWDKLHKYVEKGGGLAVVPGGEGWLPSLQSYQEDSFAAQLLPGHWLRSVAAPAGGLFWSELMTAARGHTRHAFLTPFQEWEQRGQVDFLVDEPRKPRVYRYWEVQPAKDRVSIIATYHDTRQQPALLERRVGRGRVLLLTTAFDGQRPWWNNYLESSFHLVLVNMIANYLAGEAEEAIFNYGSGQPVPVALPMAPFYPHYTLLGPGLTPAEMDLPRTQNQGDFQLTQAVTPGNFEIIDGNNSRLTAFSVQEQADESQLDKVPIDQLEALLGRGSVLTIDSMTNLRLALQDRWSQPLELAPILLLLLLFLLVGENFLANKFYRKQPSDNAGVYERPQPGAAQFGELARR